MSDEFNEADRDDITIAVTELVEKSELQHVRLTRLATEVADDVPENINAEFGIAGISAQGGDGDGGPGFLNVRISHSARFFSAEGTVAQIEFTHTAHFRYDGHARPKGEVVQHWVMGNVYFMVYPYVRETLQSACIRMDLPSVILGYLQRNQTVPRNVTVVINATQFDESIEPPPDEYLSTEKG